MPNKQRQSIYNFLTHNSLVPQHDAPDISIEDGHFIYRLAAFDVAWDSTLQTSARTGRLFNQLRCIYMAQRKSSLASVVLNAIQNAFFLMDSAWINSCCGDVLLNDLTARDLSAIATLDQEERGVKPANLIIRSAIAHTKRQHKNCARLISELIAADSLDDPIPECHYGAFTYRPPTQDTFNAINKQRMREDGINFITKAAASNLPVIVCAVDSLYFKVYATNLISSLDVFGSYGVHFHLVNPDDECFSVLDAIFRKYDRQSISISIEKSDNTAKAYYASARFLRANEILQFLRSDICILDVDISFSVAPECLFEGFRDLQCALLKRNGYPAYLPWRSVGAGAAFFKWSKGGRQSARLVAQCINYLLSEYCGDPERCWWIDQNALFLGSEMLLTNHMSFGAIPKSFISQLNHTYAEKRRLLEIYQESSVPGNL